MKTSKHPIGEAYDNGHQIVIVTDVGYYLNENHNCDAMGCGASHVLFRFTKPNEELPYDLDELNRVYKGTP